MQETFKKELLKTACARQWKKVGLEPRHGIVIMLSSLHSKKSVLCGEFLDLIPIIGWCPSVGLNFIQLLPINDSGFDNSPYNPISTFALNPIYLCLEKLPHITKDPELKKMLQKTHSVKLKKYFDYNVARSNKYKFLEVYFAKYFHLIEKTEPYKNFLKNNKGWVFDYGLYCVFCEVLGEHQWKLWPGQYQNLKARPKAKFIKEHSNRLHFYLMIQFFCFSQMEQVKIEADKNKVLLMGDLPFLVSRISCDAWSHSSLFMSHYSVGSPPDDLTPDGQEWNFPAYNWSVLRKSGYKWWLQRLNVAKHFFHIYRLDHVIGFFRTWNIPEGKNGADGCFDPKDPSLWLDHGKNFLMTLIKHSDLLPIGEDLVIPQLIKDTLRHLGVCGTNILTWQRTGAGGQDFVPFPLYPVASITHVASHDTATLCQWWHQYPKVSKMYALWKGWSYTKNLDSKKRMSILRDSHQTTSIFHANLLQEYLALFPEMVHKNYHEERINYPGTPSKTNWRYRFIPSVEQIVSSRKLSNALSTITSNS